MLAAALRRLPDAQLAALVRALPDSDLEDAARVFAVQASEAFFGQALTFEARELKTPGRPAKRSAPLVRERARGTASETLSAVKACVEASDSSLSSSEIAQATGYSVATVRAMLAPLLESGAIVATGQTRSRRYRRADPVDEQIKAFGRDQVLPHEGVEASPASDAEVETDEEDAPASDPPPVVDERPRALRSMPPAPSQAWLRP